MQEKSMYIPKLRPRLGKKSQCPLPVSSAPSAMNAFGRQLNWAGNRDLARAAGASMLALLLVSLFSSSVFAKAVPLKSSSEAAMLVMQEEAEVANAYRGLVIAAVDEAGPASQAGIVRGDILLSANDTEIDAAKTLYEAVTSAKPGDEMSIVIQHGDDLRTVAVKLAEMDGRAYLGVQVIDPPGVFSPRVEAAPKPHGEAEDDIAKSESVTATLTEDQAAESKPIVSGMAPGLIVTEVMADGPAAQAGVAIGDLILAIDGAAVITPDDLYSALKGHTPGEVALLQVQKGGPLGAAIEEIPVTLTAAPDDPSRPYLGLRFVYTATAEVIEGMPGDGSFTAPAMPVMPPVSPMPPDVIYGYPGAYALPNVSAIPAVPQNCGVTINQYYYQGSGATLSIAAPPALAPLPAIPAAPFYIYHFGVNPEVGTAVGTAMAQSTVVGNFTAPTAVEKNVMIMRSVDDAGAKTGSATIVPAPFTHAYPVLPDDVAVGVDAQQKVIMMQPQAEPAWMTAEPEPDAAIAQPSPEITNYPMDAVPETKAIPALPYVEAPGDGWY